jgi:hypothetical protein
VPFLCFRHKPREPGQNLAFGVALRRAKIRFAETPVAEDGQDRLGLALQRKGKLYTRKARIGESPFSVTTQPTRFLPGQVWKIGRLLTNGETGDEGRGLGVMGLGAWDDCKTEWAAQAVQRKKAVGQQIAPNWRNDDPVTQLKSGKRCLFHTSRWYWAAYRWCEFQDFKFWISDLGFLIPMPEASSPTIGTPKIEVPRSKT